MLYRFIIHQVLIKQAPFYFKTPWIWIFGVSCEPLSHQVDYLIDEAVAVSEGANAFISYIHHYLENYGLGEQVLQLHADNCW